MRSIELEKRDPQGPERSGHRRTRRWPWAPGPERPWLSSEVHVWSFSLDRPAQELRELREDLSVDEIARAKRFHHSRDADRSISCRGLLRRLLGRYLAVAPEEVAFTYGIQGKPFLSAPLAGSNLQFNVTHSGPRALVAVTRDTPLGVDLERVAPIEDLEAMARRFFADGEYRTLVALPPAERTAAFYRAWTRKEAVVKAMGDGLTHSLSGFRVSLGPGEPSRIVEVDGSADTARRWTLEHLAPAPEMVGALAIPATRRPIRCWSLLG